MSWWSAETGESIASSMQHPQIDEAILIEHGRQILSWSRDGTLRLWDVDSGKQIGETMNHEDEVLGAVALEKEGRILSWSRHGMRLWNNVGKQVGLTMEHRNLIPNRVT